MSATGSYLNSTHTPAELKKIVQKAVEELKPRKNEFDVIVFTGLSGAYVAPIVAYELGKPVWGIRKSEDESHDMMFVDGPAIDGARYLIIDDFIDQGDTLKRIQQKIEDERKPRQVLNFLRQPTDNWLDDVKNPPVPAGVYAYYPTITSHREKIMKHGLKPFNTAE